MKCSFDVNLVYIDKELIEHLSTDLALSLKPLFAVP